MKSKRYYTQTEVDEYVRKLLTDSEIALSKQAERIEKERKENDRLSRELEEIKFKEKTNARLLVLSERKVKNMEQSAKSKCAIELDRLIRLTDKWDEFFNDLSNKYEPQDKEHLEAFKEELSKTIDGLLDIEGMFSSGEAQVSDAVTEHEGEINRLNLLRKRKNSELDDRFTKLVLEFNMKIGDNATRGRGRPKKQESNNVNDIQKNNKKSEKVVYPPKGESGFDFEEALNPVDSLEDIMKDLMGV